MTSGPAWIPIAVVARRHIILSDELDQLPPSLTAAGNAVAGVTALVASRVFLRAAVARAGRRDGMAAFERG